MPSRSVRNSNPGNLRDSPWTRRQPGRVDADPQGFAIFANWLDGLKAMMTLLQGRTYRSLTVREAIERYAPASENDTAAYVAVVCRRSGCLPTDVIGEMPPVPFMAMVEAMIVHEGWRPDK